MLIGLYWDRCLERKNLFDTEDMFLCEKMDTPFHKYLCCDNEDNCNLNFTIEYTSFTEPLGKIYNQDNIYFVL